MELDDLRCGENNEPQLIGTAGWEALRKELLLQLAQTMVELSSPAHQTVR